MLEWGGKGHLLSVPDKDVAGGRVHRKVYRKGGHYRLVEQFESGNPNRLRADSRCGHSPIESASHVGSAILVI